MTKKTLGLLIAICVFFQQCGKKSSGGDPPPPPAPLLQLAGWSVNDKSGMDVTYDVGKKPVVRFKFTAAVDRATVPTGLSFKTASGANVPYVTTYEQGDATIALTPAANLSGITKYSVAVSPQLKSAAGTALTVQKQIDFISSIDSSRKFPIVSDEELLTIIQRQTFKYFWDFGHPTSGLARERSNGDNEIVTSGGSGFGIMAILVGIERGFVSKADGFARIQKIVAFLKNTADTFKGAYPHWLNGTNGDVIPFSKEDNGADLVETSYLIQGLLCARQYFADASPAETTLRTDINTIWNRVEWDWFRKDNGNVLYWHWSPEYNWHMNLPIRGWNECLITYILATSSTAHGVPTSLYHTGWASGSNFTNGLSYYGQKLPLGPHYGGPLFFSHYSFLGINPKTLSDQYADYMLQTMSHTLMQMSYSLDNPLKYFGYSDSVWGLTASDIPNGYAASSITNDLGVIAPTAAVSSLPYAPAQVMGALKFYYYVLGDKLFKEYGFVDAFKLKDAWFANSFLAIDQGPIIIMIENHRSGLLWNLFTSCPEIKTGMKAMGFSAPYL